MSKNTKSESENDTLEKELVGMKEKISEAEDTVNENSYHVLLKLWAKLIITSFGIGIISVLVGYELAASNQVTLSGPLFRTTNLGNITGVILAPSVTTIGRILGFTPVISFFFVNSMKDDQKNFREEKNEDLKRLSKNKVVATKENKSIVETYYVYLDLIIHNRIIGVMKYVQSFLVISLIMLPLLIESSILFSPSIFLLIDIFLIFAIVEGVIPIINICVYKPAIRIRNQFVGTDIPNQIAIKKELEAEK